VSLRPARIITELIAFTRAKGWSVRELARELEVDETALIRFRSGERTPSKAVLVKIVDRFGEHRFVRDLVWFHLYSECRNAGASGADPFSEARLPTGALSALRSYIDHFAEESTHAGRGLFIVSPDPAALTTALRTLHVAFERTRVRLCLWRGDQKPNARSIRDALAAPVVLIERIDFASEPVADVVRRRADLTRPTVVTSLIAPDALADAFLRRIAVSTMRLIQIDPPIDTHPVPTTTIHDAA
jgi:transcriptional regulator with XRE-family HTH domain